MYLVLQPQTAQRLNSPHGSVQDSHTNAVSVSYNHFVQPILIPVTPSARSTSSCAQVALELQRLGVIDSDQDLALRIIKGESTCSVIAQNKSSGAYGLGQSLPASKMAVYGTDYLTNINTQLRWSIGYMQQRYGTWSAAYSFWILHHYW